LEKGAEFIHGNLAETIHLLKEAGIKFTAVKGKHFQVRQGKWEALNEIVEGWDELIKKMEDIKEDMSIADFLKEYFGNEKYTLLRENFRHYAEGFDAADTQSASVIALRDEWADEEDIHTALKEDTSNL
jgi:hypothetical protein